MGKESRKEKEGIGERDWMGLQMEMGEENMGRKKREVQKKIKNKKIVQAEKEALLGFSMR